ncbi:MAG: cytochrome c oxidase accessory protein CcoG, partial [Opitutales bacterium]
VVALALMALFLVLPWIPVGGQPAVFLDVVQRRFHLFGVTLAAQDAWLLFFLITGLGFTLFFVTSLLGRVWCGWACPQTVFLEHLYRRVERWLEGDHVRQRKIDAMDWSDPRKLRTRGVKMVIFLILSAVIAHLFLAYFVSMPELYGYMTAAPEENFGAFAFIAAFTGILFFNFTWFREQLCLIICPYGRFQSALIDDDTMVIGYDETRGEPRGSPRNPQNGDCIDCNRCVQVCPTGIDIRQGLQMECIGCANCIDACDAIMDKLNRPRGLVRYDSTNGLAGGKRRWLRPRLFLYGGLMLAGVTVMAVSVNSIDPVHVGVRRMVTSPYVIDRDDRTIRNQYQLRLINKQDSTALVEVSLHDVPEGHELIGVDGPIELAPMEETSVPFIVRASIDDYQGRFTGRVEAVSESGSLRMQKSFDFVGPDPERLKARYVDE